MENKYKKLLGSINLIEPPKGLANQIVFRIREEEKRLARIKALAFGGSGIVSSGLSLWAAIYFINSIKETGFGKYFSLIFSENGAILSYWRELSLSLIETLPVIGLMALLGAIAFFVWSATNIFKNRHSYGSFMLAN